MQENPDFENAAPTQDRSIIINRLKRIEGQVRGLQRMVEEERDCGDILTQLLAARSSLDQVAIQIFNTQIDNCLAPVEGSDAETRRALQDALKLWAKLL